MTDITFFPDEKSEPDDISFRRAKEAYFANVNDPILYETYDGTNAFPVFVNPVTHHELIERLEKIRLDKNDPIVQLGPWERFEGGLLEEILFKEYHFKKSEGRNISSCRCCSAFYNRLKPLICSFW